MNSSSELTPISSTKWKKRIAWPVFSSLSPETLLEKRKREMVLNRIALNPDTK